MSRLFLRHCQELGILDRIAAAVTIGDQDNINLLESNKVRFIEAENMPLGAKHNAALRLAMDMGGTKFMVLPSDDFISKEWLDVFDASNEDYVSPDRCALVDVKTGAAKVVVNRKFGNRNFGAGRFFSRNVVDALGGAIWTDRKVSGLDTDSHGRIALGGFTGIVRATESIPIADLKTEDNLWPFGMWKGEPIDVRDALHMAPWVMQVRC